MTYKHLARALVLSVPVVLSGCVDSSYDLNDLDTTTKVSVNNLTLPINVAPIKLDKILDIDSDPNGTIQVQQIGNEKYYVVKQGAMTPAEAQSNPNYSFSSGEIEVDKVSVKSSYIKPSEETLKLKAENLPANKRTNADIPDLNNIYWTYNLEDRFGSEFNYLSNDVPMEIVSVVSIGVEPFDFKMTISLPDFDKAFDEITVKNFNIELPKGFSAEVVKDDAMPGSYFDEATGIWHIPELKLTGKEKTIGLKATGVSIEGDEEHHIGNGELVYKGKFYIQKGIQLVVKPHAPDMSNLPDPDPTLKFRIDYNVGDLNVTEFTGGIKYTLDDLKIDPVSLNGIPDFLNQDETIIKLSNPQIYVSITNPLYEQKKVTVETGLEILANRKYGVQRSFTPERDIVLGNQHGEGPYNYVLAPNCETAVVPDMYKENLDQIDFPQLRDLLAPVDDELAGLPLSIDIKLPGAGIIPTSSVQNFKLGTNIGEVKGSWLLMAPLALVGDSHIIYRSDDARGWYSDEMNDLHINDIRIIADAVNNAPVAISLAAYPVDRDGNEIPGVVLETKDPLPSGTPTTLIIELKNPDNVDICGLDGMNFLAMLSNPNGTPLSPEQTLVLKNIRVVVDGYYQTKF